MAQHDYVIDNSTGANVRADINSALLAISSNNSGSSAPSTTYALQSFADTTNDMLKLRNEANNGFVNLRMFDGSLPLPDGSESSPSLFFDNDNNTGIYSSGADTLNITTGGSTAVTVDSSQRVGIGTTSVPTGFKISVNGDLSLGETGGSDNSFIDQKQNGQLEIINSGRDDNAGGIRINRVNNISGDTTYFRDVNIYDGKGTSVMFVDGSAASVGINTSVPRTTLDVEGDLAVAYAADYAIRFYNQDRNNWSSINNNVATGSSAANLNFNTSGGHAMIINSTGVGIGTTSVNQPLQLTKSSGNAIFELNRSDSNTTGAHGTISFTASDGHSVASIGTLGDGDNEGAHIVFRTTSAAASNDPFNSATPVRMTIDSSGNIGAPSGSNIHQVASDLRLKKNIVDLDKGLSAIKSLRPVSFNWIDGFCDEEKDTLYGFIAQEVQSIDSNLIEPSGRHSITVVEQTIDNPLRIKEKFIVPMLVKAIQELSAKVDALEAA